MSVSFPNMKEEHDTTYTKRKICRIDLHIFCLLEDRHRHRVVESCKKHWKRYDGLFSFFFESIRECTYDSYDSEYTTELIHIKCLCCSIGEEKSRTSYELPCIHTCSLYQLTTCRHNLWEIHIDTEIIPSYRHGSDNIYKCNTEKKGEKEESKFYRNKLEIEFFYDISTEIMIYYTDTTIFDIKISFYYSTIANC